MDEPCSLHKAGVAAWANRVAPLCPGGRAGRCLLVCLMVLVMVPGCRGCFRLKTPEEIAAAKKKAEEEEKRRKEKKPDYEIAADMRFRPGLPVNELDRWGKGSDPADTESEGDARRRGRDDASWYKPGHWMCGMLSARANNFSVYGDLETTAVHGQHEPAYLTGMPFHARATRPISLEQGKLRVLETVFYMPPGVENPLVDCRITARQGVGGQIDVPEGIHVMPPYQYHFVVLARSPSRYNFLTDLDTVRMPSDLSDWRQMAYYRIVLLDGARPPPLPDFGLFWTTVAYLLWDDADPSSLNSDQRQALLDWLHWGGQLILSGPDTIEGLQTSFLKDYLPATSPGAGKLTDKDLSEINQHWTLPGHEPLRAVARGAWTSVRLQKQAEARAVPGTGSLVLQRRVGRGRVVLTAFRLNESELRAWRSFDGFFNGAILGRPPRKFSSSWQQVTWADHPELQYDPCRLCQLRYFSRDAGRRLTLYDPNNASFPQLPASVADPQPASDVASWNDFSETANLVRKSLKTAALLEAPPRSFVLWFLGGYLVVLVPVNWFLFRLIGRVEWAWVAAPLVAVACSLIVIRLARLDIGFARARFEVDVLEMQGQYARAHLTRYVALYTSLTTDYTLHADTLGAQFQPFSPLEPAEPGQPRKEVFNQEERQLQYLYGNDVTMEGLRVRSNTTGLAHAEEMRDMGGPITLARAGDGTDRVTNGTTSKLQGTLVARWAGNGRAEVAWVGTLDPGQSAPLEFQPARQQSPAALAPAATPARAADAAGWQRAWNQSTISADRSTPGELCLGRLLRMAVGDEPPVQPPPSPKSEGQNAGPLMPPGSRPSYGRSSPYPPGNPTEPGLLGESVDLSLEPGEVRLVAWSTEEYAGVEIRPKAPQSHQASVIVAHLAYQPTTQAQRDENQRPPNDADAAPAAPADPGQPMSADGN